MNAKKDLGLQKASKIMPEEIVMIIIFIIGFCFGVLCCLSKIAELKDEITYQKKLIASYDKTLAKKLNIEV